MIFTILLLIWLRSFDGSEHIFKKEDSWVKKRYWVEISKRRAQRRKVKLFVISRVFLHHSHTMKVELIIRSRFWGMHNSLIYNFINILPNFQECFFRKFQFSSFCWIDYISVNLKTVSLQSLWRIYHLLKPIELRFINICDWGFIWHTKTRGNWGTLVEC